jgi:O-succinylbenzoate synthase
MAVPFRGQERRRGMLIQGPAGWGEFSPFPEYGAEESSRWLAAALEAAHQGWPAPVRMRIPVNTTVPAVDPEQARSLVLASGCSTVKVKVAEAGQTLNEDIERVEAVRDALGPAGHVRIDANAAWTIDEATDALTILRRFDLEYAEQPVASLDDMATLRKRVNVRLAADESVRKAEDPMRVAGLEAADIVVLKVQPLGGVRACLEVAEACGLPVVVSSALESSVGIAAGVALAAALPDLPFACGLGTVSLLGADVTSKTILPVDGTIAVALSAPTPDLIDTVAADPDVDNWWQERLTAVQTVLQNAR